MHTLQGVVLRFRHSAAHDIVAVLPQLINLRFERVSRLDKQVARREVGVGTERAT